MMCATSWPVRLYRLGPHARVRPSMHTMRMYCVCVRSVWCMVWMPGPVAYMQPVAQLGAVAPLPRVLSFMPLSIFRGGGGGEMLQPFPGSSPQKPQKGARGRHAPPYMVGSFPGAAGCLSGNVAPPLHSVTGTAGRRAAHFLLVFLFRLPAEEESNSGLQGCSRLRSRCSTPPETPPAGPDHHQTPRACMG